ncbi:MAG: hypothetical protein ACT4OE_10500 [Sphingosinicella sp.]
MTSWRILAAAALALAPAACSAPPPEPGARSAAAPGSGVAAVATNEVAAPVDDERAQCEARGGQLAQAGLSGGMTCVLPTPDAGRACRGSPDCQGRFCLLDQRRLGGKRPEPGAEVPGACQPTDYLYGCRDTVENGRFQGALCID